MAETIEAFAAEADPKPKSEFLNAGGQTVFRTVYPSFAREQSCVDCHNSLQPDKLRWKVNDLMGAFVIDVPAAPFLHTILAQSAGLGVLLFVALGLAGLVISRQHFLQMTERELAAAEIGRARKFLDTVIENIPAVVTVKDAGDETYVLANRSAECCSERHAVRSSAGACTTSFPRKRRTFCAPATARCWNSKACRSSTSMISARRTERREHSAPPSWSSPATARRLAIS